MLMGLKYVLIDIFEKIKVSVEADVILMRFFFFLSFFLSSFFLPACCCWCDCLLERKLEYYKTNDIDCN